MAAFTTRISETSVESLRRLLGRRIHTIYAPCLAVASQHLAAPSLSFPISDLIEGRWKHRFVNTKATWHETPRLANDYWSIEADLEDTAHGIKASSDGALFAPCSINFYQDSPIERIDIYSVSTGDSDQERDDESCEFDGVWRFIRKDESSFCIACQLDGPGIATDVHLSEHTDVMTDFLERSRLRLTIT